MSLPDVQNENWVISITPVRIDGCPRVFSESPCHFIRCRVVGTADALSRTARDPGRHSPSRGQHRRRTALKAGTPHPLDSRVGTWLHASPACGASWECLNTATFSGGTAIAK